jgi:glucose/arabinose dehydrogenase
MRVVPVMLLLVGALVGAQAPQLPAPFATPSATNAPRVVEPPAGAMLHVPQGFSVSTWASGFDMPRFMLLAPGGEILLSDSGAGIVYVFVGGKPESKKPLVMGLNRPYGLAVWQNYLYVAETNRVRRFPYDAKALTVGTVRKFCRFRAAATTGRARLSSTARVRSCMSAWIVIQYHTGRGTAGGDQPLQP